MTVPTPPPRPRVLLILGGSVDGRPHSGGHLRRHHTILAATALGSATAVVLGPATAETLDTMADVYGVPVVAPPDTAREPSARRGRISYAVDRRRPTKSRWRRRPLEEWLRPLVAASDVVFVELLSDYAVVSRALTRPTVVDLDDLEDQRVQHRIDDLRTGLRRGTSPWTRRLSQLLRDGLQLGLELERRHRWRVATTRCRENAAAVLVCSNEDRELMPGGPDVTVVPNGYETSREPVGRDEVRTPPTVAFIGHFGYPPNAEGAAWYLGQVLPLLRAECPDLRTVIVGSHSELLDLPADEGVTATGRVDDPVDELARADVVVVPLLAGVGTRIKVIEAWAYGVPVVSTTVGAYGLGAQDEVDVLLADTPAAFAAAVMRLLDDTDLRRLLRENGLQRAAGLTWERSRARLTQVLADSA
jgi:polysaccharide biosynthesis protein PslH